MLPCTTLPLVLGVLGSSDTTTIVNSVLSGYGLPMIPSAQGFNVLDEIEYAFTLE
jgi:hypothetical protein